MSNVVFWRKRKRGCPIKWISEIVVDSVTVEELSDDSIETTLEIEEMIANEAPAEEEQKES